MRRVLVLAVFGLLAVAALATRPGNDTPVAHAATSTVITTVGQTPYNVPAGVQRLLIKADGAAGAASACGSAGGFGAERTAIVTVTPGTTLFVTVGGVGTGTLGGFNGGGAGGAGPGGTAGGGGGGASDVRTTAGSIATALVVAGGGGGGGGCGTATSANAGGAGGTGSFGAGANGSNGQGAAPGNGGTSGLNGGLGGTGFAAGTNHIAELGGNGAPATPQQTFMGGAGGGGGGGNSAVGGGGGGGSGSPAVGSGGGGGGGGFTSTTGTTVGGTPDINPAAAGSVTITPWDPPVIAKSFAPATITPGGTSTMTISITQPASNAVVGILTNLAFTDDFSSLGITIVALVSNSCNGTVTAIAGTSLVSLTGGGNFALGTTCNIVVTVTSQTLGTKVNTTSVVTSTENTNGNVATATLVVSANTPTVTPTATPTTTPVIAFVPPVIPQVFQHIPQGIFTNPHPNTPTPIIRAAVVAPAIDPGAMPVLRPPSTGDAGLKTGRGSGYSPLIAAAAVLVIGAGAAWSLRAR